MSLMSGSAPAGTPSVVRGRGSSATFSTWLKSLKLSVRIRSGSGTHLGSFRETCETCET